MPPRRCLPSPGPTWMMVLGIVGSRVARSVGVGRAVPARVLPGPLRPPGKGLAGGTCFVPLLFVVLALALLWLSWASVLPWLTSPVLLGVTVGAAPTARAQVMGYKVRPSLCTPTGRKSVRQQFQIERERRRVGGRLPVCHGSRRGAPAYTSVRKYSYYSSSSH